MEDLVSPKYQMQLANSVEVDMGVEIHIILTPVIILHQIQMGVVLQT
jgi:hypothetical protein